MPLVNPYVVQRVATDPFFVNTWNTYTDSWDIYPTWVKAEGWADLAAAEASAAAPSGALAWPYLAASVLFLLATLGASLMFVRRRPIQISPASGNRRLGDADPPQSRCDNRASGGRGPLHEHACG